MLTKDYNLSRHTTYRHAVEVDEANTASGGFWEGTQKYLQYGIGAGIVSAGVDFYNTARSVGNMLGDDHQRVDVTDVLDNMGFENAAEYAANHSTAVSMTGLIAGSFVPGVGGLRLARATQKGLTKMEGRGRTTLALRGALVPRDQVAKYRNAVRKGNLADTQTTALRDAAVQGFHQNAVETAFAEVAVLATMNQNVLLNPDDLDYFDSFIDNTFSWGGLTALGAGTLLGGTVSTAIGTRQLNAIANAPATGVKELLGSVISGPREAMTALPLGTGAAQTLRSRIKLLRALEDPDKLASRQVQAPGSEGLQAVEMGQEGVAIARHQLKATDLDMDEWFAALTVRRSSDESVAGKIKDYNSHALKSMRNLYDSVKNDANKLEDFLSSVAGTDRIEAGMMADNLSDVRLLPVELRTSNQILEESYGLARLNGVDPEDMDLAINAALVDGSDINALADNLAREVFSANRGGSIMRNTSIESYEADYTKVRSAIFNSINKATSAMRKDYGFAFSDLTRRAADRPELAIGSTPRVNMDPDVINSLGEKGVIGVLRHELGHVRAGKFEGKFVPLAKQRTAKFLGKTLDEEGIKNPNFNAVLSQAEELSRRARPEQWKTVDKFKRELPSLEKAQANLRTSLTKLSKSSPDYDATYRELEQVTKYIKEQTDFAEYMHHAPELFADSASLFNSSYKELWSKYPQLYSLFYNNDAALRNLGPRKMVMDVRTGDKFNFNDRQPTLADLGPVQMKGNRVMHAKGETDISKPFNALEASPEDASAYYFAAMQEPVFTGSTLEFQGTQLDKFITTMRAANEPSNVNKTLRVKVKRVGTGKVEELLIPAGQGQARDGAISKLRRMQVEEKMDTLDQMRNTPLHQKKGHKLVYGNKGELEAARVLDIDHMLINELPVFRQTGNYPSTADGVSWSEAYDVTSPTATTFVYRNKRTDHSNQAVLTEEAQRVQEWRKSTTTSMLGLISGFSKVDAFPSSATSEWNPMINITADTKIGGALTATQGSYGEGISIGQQIGDINSKMAMDMAKHIEGRVGASGIALKNDQQALYEWTALEQRLREKFFKEVTTDEPMEYLASFAQSELGEVLQAAASDDATRMVQQQFAQLAEALDPIFSKPAAARLITEELEDTLHAMVTQIVEGAKAGNPSGIRPASMRQLEEMLDYDVLHVKNPKVAAFGRDLRSVTDEFYDRNSAIQSAKGGTNTFHKGVWHPGPPDKSIYKHVAFVEGVKGKEAIFGARATQHRIIGANTPEGLETKKRQIIEKYGDDVVIRVPNQVEATKRLEQDFDVDLTYNSRDANSNLKRQGHFVDLAPEPSPARLDNIVNNAKRTGKKQVDEITELMYWYETQQLRNGVNDVHRFSSDTGTARHDAKEASAYQKLLNVMYNRSSTGKDSAWRKAQRNMDEAFSGMVNNLTAHANRVFSNKEKVDLELMNQMFDDYNMPRVYTDDVMDYFLHQRNVNPELLASWAPRINALSSKLMLRWDLIQPIVNMLSMPIMAQTEFKTLIESMPRLQQQQRAIQNLEELTAVPVPGTNVKEFSNGRMLMQATKDFWDKDIVERYARKGLLGDMAQEAKDVVDLTARMTRSLEEPKVWKQNLAKFDKVAAKLSDQSEVYSKFIAARQAELVLDAIGITDRGLRDSTMRTYTTRLVGNYTAAQRPLMFQGWAGQVFGLFQTYQFNMIQQLLRATSHDPMRAAATMSVQAGIFGAQSVPGFNYMNNFIAERSLGEADFFTGTADVFGDEMMEWTLFGAASNLTRPLVGDGLDLFNRGNLNPRTPILLPTSPMEVPAISMALNGFRSTYNMVDQIANGAPAGQAFAEALSHNGMNRPLAGLGELMAGGRTTRHGTSIMTTEDMSAWQRYVRLLGTKPLSENIATSHFYRSEQYQADRRANLQRLGSRLKTTIRGSDFGHSEYYQFMEQYVDQGGDIENYARWAQDQGINATQSYINNVAQSNNTIQGRYLQGLMGADLTSRVGANRITPEPLNRANEVKAPNVNRWQDNMKTDAPDAAFTGGSQVR